MPTYALVNDFGDIVRRKTFDSSGGVPTLSPQKPLRWIADNPPAVKPWQTRTVQAPIGTDATEVPYSVSDIPLEDYKAERKAEATALFREHRDAGTTVTIGGQAVTIETTHISQQELFRAAQRLEGTPNKQKAVTRSGFRAQFDATMMAAARDAAEAHYSACVDREYDLHEQINNAADHQEVADIDVTSGWPT